MRLHPRPPAAENHAAQIAPFEFKCSVPYGQPLALPPDSGGDLAEPPEPSAAQQAEITEFVMSYFARHPRAMDTAAGVLEWWMPKDAVRIDVATMKRILDRLTDHGLLERIGSGEYAHYRLKNP